MFENNFSNQLTNWIYTEYYKDLFIKKRTENQIIFPLYVII